MAGIFLVDLYSDAWDPAAVRASMGSLFSQKLARCSHSELRNWARNQNVPIVGSSPSGLLSYKEMQWRRAFVLAIGNEKKGVSEQLSEVCDIIVRIPMTGACDSINVAVAMGVLLFEAFTQRSELGREEARSEGCLNFAVKDGGERSQNWRMTADRPIAVPSWVGQPAPGCGCLRG